MNPASQLGILRVALRHERIAMLRLVGCELFEHRVPLFIVLGEHFEVARFHRRRRGERHGLHRHARPRSLPHAALALRCRLFGVLFALCHAPAFVSSRIALVSLALSSLAATRALTFHSIRFYCEMRKRMNLLKYLGTSWPTLFRRV